MMQCGNKSRLLMQFHITGKCNLSCKHCYRTQGDAQPLSFNDIIGVIQQFDELKTLYNKNNRVEKKAHINLTGGEPLLREDIFDLLNYMGKNRDKFSYGILTNGTLIDEKMTDSLKKNRVSFVQLSVDGNRRTHDSLRTPGDYKRTFKTASLLEKSGIKTFISFTANKSNYKQLPTVARKCRRCSVTKLWTDRLVPIGRGAELNDLVIDKENLPGYLKSLKKARGNCLIRKIYPKTQIAAERALQFLNISNSPIYSCSAGDSLITVDEFGNIMPCRRLPLVCGNVFENPLKTVYFENDVFKSLRSKTIPKECAGCLYSTLCLGGAKCQSYALHGSYSFADAGCPLIR